MREERLILPRGYAWRNDIDADVHPNYLAEDLDKCGPLGSVKMGRAIVYTTPGLDEKQKRRVGENPITYIQKNREYAYFVVNNQYACMSKFIKKLNAEERVAFEDALPEIMGILNLD